MMFDQKAGDETESFRCDIEVEIITKSLAAVRTEIAAIRLRRREQTEFHARIRCPGRKFSKSRQVGKCGPSCMHMHASEFRAAVQRRKHLAGIEQALVVEGAFEPLLLIEIGFREHRRHKVPFFTPTPVSAGHTPATSAANPKNIGAELLGALELARLVGVIKNK